MNNEDVENSFEDKTIKCDDCGKDFEFTAGEQKFYKEKGFQDPKRCSDCRKARKRNKPQNRNDNDDFNSSFFD